jgi:hypothetical protein
VPCCGQRRNPGTRVVASGNPLLQGFCNSTGNGLTGLDRFEYSVPLMIRDGRKRRPWALVLAGGILALTAMAGPDTLQHLRTTVKDFHACAIYHWAHGAGSGAPAAVSLVVSLPFVAAAPPDVPLAPPDVSAPSASSRAPPAIA